MPKLPKCGREGCPGVVTSGRKDRFCSELCKSLSRTMSRLKDEAFRAEERGHDLASYDQRYDALVAVFRAVDAYRALVQPPDP